MSEEQACPENINNWQKLFKFAAIMLLNMEILQVLEFTLSVVGLCVFEYTLIEAIEKNVIILDENLLQKLEVSAKYLSQRRDKHPLRYFLISWGNYSV